MERNAPRLHVAVACMQLNAVHLGSVLDRGAYSPVCRTGQCRTPVHILRSCLYVVYFPPEYSVLFLVRT